MSEVILKATLARVATPLLANVSAKRKNEALHRMADALLRNVSTIIEANAADLARGSEELSASLLDPSHAEREADRGDRRRAAINCRIAGSARRDAAGIFAPKRAAHREGASAARGHWHYL